MVLILLAILIAALAATAALAHFVPRTVLPRMVLAGGCVGICAVVVVLAIVALAGIRGTGSLELPVGPLGAVSHLALDPLAASFLLLLFVVMPCAAREPLPLAAIALVLLAADGFTLSLGVLLLGATGNLRLAACTAACVIVGFALAGSMEFAVLRASPPEGWRAAALLLLTLAAATALVRINTAIAGYLVFRVLVDLCGTGQPLWWGVPLLLAGVAIATIGSLRAALAETLPAAVSFGSLQQFGFAAMGLAVALFARAVDLPSVASRALDAAWLALVCHVMCRTLLLLFADAVGSGAGTQLLDRLGGLIHRMPITIGAGLAGLFAVAVLPPGLGFASFWLVFQSLLAAARIADLGLQVLVAGAAALTALSVGLAAVAMVRIVGVAFLGRPRTPRTAVADESPRPAQCVLGGLAALTLLFGLFPAIALLPAVGWANAMNSMTPVGLRIGVEAPGYASVVVAVLLVATWLVISRALRRSGEQRREPAWFDGFAAPPAWLPFGDPATQYGAASFSEPLRRALALLPSTVALRGRLLGMWGAVSRALAALVAT